MNIEALEESLKRRLHNNGISVYEADLIQLDMRERLGLDHDQLDSSALSGALVVIAWMDTVMPQLAEDPAPVAALACLGLTIIEKTRLEPGYPGHDRLVTTSDAGSCYHYDPNCLTLLRSKFRALLRGNRIHPVRQTRLSYVVSTRRPCSACTPSGNEFC